MNSYACRGCGSKVLETLVDLGLSPVSNEFLPENFELSKEVLHPLHAIVCVECSLVQLTNNLNREDLFKSDYVYFSSYSKSWLKHCENYAEKMILERNLNSDNLVVEIASNDGYLLQFFKSKDIGVLGIEPTMQTAFFAQENHGIPTIVDFFGTKLAKDLTSKSGKKADLLIGNNVLAHVPDLHDFIGGISEILSKDGVATFEFPHISNLLAQVQFDTIYHEHYSYLGVVPLIPLFEKFGLEIVKVEHLETHGGSLRIHIQHKNPSCLIDDSVRLCIELENSIDPRLESTRLEFQARVIDIKTLLNAELAKAKELGLSVVAYGAAAKGNTLLNYCGITSQEIALIIDNNPHKQGLLAPGSHIKVVPLDKIDSKPDLVLILPWNLKKEIFSSFDNTLLQGTKAFIAIPRVEYVN